MREYGMFGKDGEIIYRVKSENIMEAITHFSFIKQINVEVLLEIFSVKEIKL